MGSSNIPEGYFRSDDGKARGGYTRRPETTPFGSLPVSTAKNTPGGDAKYTPIGRDTPAAAAAMVEKHLTKHKPELVAKRAKEGK